MNMKDRLLKLLNAAKAFGVNEETAMYEFGLFKDKHYDVLVVAPSWKPTKIMVDYYVDD